MSRTFRRTDAKFLKKTIVDDYFFKDGTLKEIPFRFRSRNFSSSCQLKKILEAYFYQDNHSGTYNPPSSVGKGLNKKIKRKNKQLLNLLLSKHEEDDFIAFPTKRNAAWIFF